MEKLCNDLFLFWYPKILNNRIPLSRRLRILNNATRIDRNAIRKLIPRALTAVRMTASRRLRFF
jgi:hypothetical protein